MTHDPKNPTLTPKEGMVITFEPAGLDRKNTFSTAQKVTAAIVVIVAGVLIWRFV